MSEKPHLIHIDPTGFTTEQRERLLNQRPLVRHIRSAITWLGIGALVHAWFLGPDFEPENLWSWGYLLAWPIPMTLWLALQLAIFGLWILLAAVLFAIGWFGGKWFFEWLDERHRAREVTRFNERERSQ